MLKLKKEPGEYMRENIYVTSSGMNFWPQVRMAQDVLGPDHVMFALDYPFENLKDGVKAMDEAPMPDDVKHKFYHGIAEKIFKIPA